jgi:serine/threonine-protein kinase HipA
MQSVEEQFRRMVFNIIGRNQDDHVKNIAFLMNKRGEWSLSPAFDMTYSFNASGLWTSSHQMTLNEKSDDFVLGDFKSCAKAASMKRGRAEAIIEEVRSVVARWRDYADEVGVNPGQRDKIQNALRLDPFSRK